MGMHSEVTMGNLPTETSASTAPPRRLPFFLVGVVLFFLGPAIYAVQLRLKHFGMPWHIPILATLGIGLMAVSLWQRRGIVRGALLVLFGLVCGFEWFFALVVTPTPAYNGPKPGDKLPAFTTTLARGEPLTNADLDKGNRTLLVFFRGRW
jgi:hypothetical protein